MVVEADFFEAVKANDVVQVASSLQQQPQLVHSVSEHRKTALHWAAENDALEMAGLLIDRGSDLEAKTSWGASPLDWAAAVGSRGVGELLIARGAGGLNLIVAAGLGRLDDVKAIVAANRDLAAHRRRDAPTTPDGDHWFSDSAHVQGDVLSDAFCAAARNGRTDVVQFLLDAGANIDARGVFGGTSLHWAAMHGHKCTVQLLVSRGANRTIRDHRFESTPAEWACEGGHAGIVQDSEMTPGP